MADRWGNSERSDRLYHLDIQVIDLDSKITLDGDCSYEIKRWLLLGRKAMTNLNSVFKSKNIMLPTKVPIVKAMVFPVAMYGCESWTIKMSEHQKINTFKLWCWRRLFRILWTAKISNQSVLMEINPEYSLQWLMLKQKLQIKSTGTNPRNDWRYKVPG